MSQLIFSRSDGSSNEWPNPQRRKEVGRDHTAGNRLRLTLAAEVEGGIAVDCKLFEYVILVTPVQVVCRGYGKLGYPREALRGRHMPNLHQLSGILIRKRAQQHGIHHTKDRGVCSDAQCQYYDRDRRESGALGQNAQTIFEILQQGSHQLLLLTTGFVLRSEHPNRNMHMPWQFPRAYANENKTDLVWTRRDADCNYSILELSRPKMNTEGCGLEAV